MTATQAAPPVAPQPKKRFWFARQVLPYVRLVVLGFLPCPDLIARHRMRRTAAGLASFARWPAMQATSDDTAKLTMLRLLWLQRQTRRAVRGRHREASVMLARACAETLLLGIYCLREPEAVNQLNAATIKALGDSLAFAESLDIAPASVIRECAAKLGQPKSPPKVWRMAEVVDQANGNSAARDIYRRLYAPLSNFTVHASGGTLLRHVGREGKPRMRPAKAWNRRSPARVADAATGILAAAVAHKAGLPTARLEAYASRHESRALLPMAVMGLSGAPRAMGPGRLIRNFRTARDVYDWLWHGQAAAQPLDVRTAYIRDRFAEVLDVSGLDVPPDTLDPFIDYVADKLARLVADEQP